MTKIRVGAACKMLDADGQLVPSANLTTTTVKKLTSLSPREREDYQDVSICQRYAKELADAGNTITTKEYKGAYHAWDGGGRRFRYEQAHSAKPCDLELQMTTVAGSGLGKNARDLKKNQELKNYDEWHAAVRGCMAHVRAAVGGDAAQSDAVVADVLKFMGVQ